MFVTLRGGEARFLAFQRHVQEIMGRPINVERGSDLLRLRQIDNVADIERDGLLLRRASWSAASWSGRRWCGR